MATNKTSKKRIIHSLDSPFVSIEWPYISQEDQDTILELLCSLLSPIGRHRSRFCLPSKGRRKRRQAQKKEKPMDGQATALPECSDARPLPPELTGYVNLGMTCITRNLQELSGDVLQSSSAGDGLAQKHIEGKDRKPGAIIFIARSGQSTAFHSHLPQMVAAATTRSPPGNETRLVGLSRPCSDRLSECLGIPRVSSISLQLNAPGAEGLVDFVLKHVQPVTIPWLEEAKQGEYKATKIRAIETTAGPKRLKGIASAGKTIELVKS